MHPIAFKLGSLSVHWYGVLVALGFVAGLWTASRRAPLAGISGERVGDLIPWLIVGALLGARTLYVITFWGAEFRDAPFWEVFMIHHGGLVYYGGLAGASLACILGCRFYKLPLWTTADVLSPSIALGYVFGRIGCLMNGCCYGHACELPWAIRFPDAHQTAGQPVHPTQIYESLLNLAFYGVLAWLFRRRKFDGQIFAIYLIGYAVLRSVVERFRGDYPADQIHAGLTPAHWVSIGIFATGVVLLVVRQQLSPKRG